MKYGGAQEPLRREAEDGTGGAGGWGSAGAPSARAEAGARALDGGRALPEPVRGGRARVPVRGRARPRGPHLRVRLQLLGSAGRAHLRAAQLRAPAPRRLAAAPQDPARALPLGPGPKDFISCLWLWVHFAVL